MVDTSVSFASSPVKVETVACQDVQPSGRKTGIITLPISAKIDLSVSTTCK